MSAHTSAQPQRIEVITRGDRRRWSAEEKQAIVAESLEPNASIAGIARKHGIGTGQLYAWRHQFLARRPSTPAHFARVALLPEPLRSSGLRTGLIEIGLPDGATLAGGRSGCHLYFACMATVPSCADNDGCRDVRERLLLSDSSADTE